MQTWVTIFVAALSSGFVGALAALFTKTLEERRLRNAGELERDLRMGEMFVKLMDLAHGRGPATVVTPVAEAVCKHEVFVRELDRLAANGSRDTSLLRDLAKLAVVPAPVGHAAQLAAAALLASLATRHDVIHQATVTGLTEVKRFVPELPLDQLLGARGGTSKRHP